MNVEREAWQVYATLVAGGVAVVPTVAGYGLLAMGPKGVARIYDLKGRPKTKPCVLVSPWRVFDEVAAPIQSDVREWIVDTIRWTPLAVVAAVNPGSRMLASLDPFVRAQCTCDGTIATFHEAGLLVTRVAEIAFEHGRLVFGSSGNRSGAGNAYTLEEVPARFQAELIIDCGPLPIPGGVRLATTILDLQNGRFLREGLHFERILASWEERFATEDSLAAG
jgi:tRNA A37 threonylcarbamoyladenosine synthetase subunit TsaC/SUA5/YrdC